MTFFLTFHDPLHNVPRSISAARLSTLFGAFSTTASSIAPLRPSFRIRFLRRITPAFHNCSLHLLFTPMRRRETAIIEAERATFICRRRANYRRTLNIYRSPPERARIYSKRSLIFQRKPALLLRAKRRRTALFDDVADGSLITDGHVGLSSRRPPIAVSSAWSDSLIQSPKILHRAGRLS